MSLTVDAGKLPLHVGIIMDGNGRWATKRGLPRSQGHKEGAKVFRTICEYAADIGIKYLTFYAFSTENWARPQQEVEAVMDLFREYLEEARQRQEENIEKGFRLRYIGDLSALPADIVEMVEIAQRESQQATKTVVNLAVNYGGRQEILKSVRSLAKEVALGNLNADAIELDDIEKGLYTAGQPDPDLIIRPSGEYRLSNFLIWQAAYSEFWYSDILWPDFTTDDLDKALEDFANRNRRFGGV
ncbi:MAG TPA: isoprenyl transferase [Clostridiales bacterium]|jgi:undecaprenyl diphosphate synthase|nr:isoprenyl transferase [Clostridiales bacterium]